MEKKYIVGVDYGHGETSGWIVPIMGEDAGHSLRIRNSMHAIERVCPSIVYFNPINDHYSLSELPYYLVRFGFKAKPSVLNELENHPQKEAFASYVKLIIEALIAKNDELCVENGESNFILCVACPTRWSESEKRDYLSFLTQAMMGTGVEPKWVINESDAAFFASCGKPGINVDQNLGIDVNVKDCTLVIDYGSSTIDYTVMKDGKKVSDDDWSNPQLGASLVEKAIIHDYMDKNHDSYQNIMEAMAAECDRLGCSLYNQEEIKRYLEKDTREAKEGVFVKGTWPNMNQMNFSMFNKCGGLGSGYNDKIELKISGVLTQMPSFVAYRDAVKKDFENLKVEIDNKLGTTSLKHIILSGGACVMTWVRPMLQEVFGRDMDIQNQKEEDPAYIVSKGIAYYAKAQLKAIGDLKPKINSLPFVKFYKEADTKATRKAIKMLMPDLSAKIRNELGKPTGWDVIKFCCDFIRGLDEKNKVFSCCVQEELEKSISERVGQSLSEVIEKVFAVKSDMSDIHIHIVPPILCWDDANFKPRRWFWQNRTLYDRMVDWVSAVNRPLDSIFTQTDLEKVSDKVCKSLCKFVDDVALIYDQAMDEIQGTYSKEICEQTKKEAERVFYNKRLLFDTFTVN